MKIIKKIICFLLISHKFKYYKPEKYDNEELEKVIPKVQSGTLGICQRCGISIGEYLKI